MENSMYQSITTHPQILTIRETARTGILPEATLRRLVKQGKCPGFYSGRKFLVNYDRLCDWLNETTIRDERL